MNRIDKILICMVVVLFVVLFMLSAQIANAQPPGCNDRDALIANLQRGYGESRQTVALDAAGRLIEVLANLTTGSWTAVMTTADGVSCIVASGYEFEAVHEVISDEEPT